MSNEIRNKQIINWLLEGDVSVQYQVYRDLLDINGTELQDRIEKEGWGQHYLSKRKSNLHWGDQFYQPKWISTHYTLLDLRNLNIRPDQTAVKETINNILKSNIALDGGIKLGPSTSHYSDVCVNGMFLNYASYFKSEERKLYSIVDSILNEVMPDGGFNCRTTRSGATHSSLHTTISVLEGLYEFQKSGFKYRKEEIKNNIDMAEEFILLHQLYLSDRTGEIINKAFIKIPYPCRWKYDILRALDYFQYTGKSLDFRMNKAIGIIQDKRNNDGTWVVNTAHPGQVHFTMEKAGKPSRWNTLRALRVFEHFNNG
ncbi:MULTISPECIES: hypothetical protein [unclassified Oceanispirochaeta]|uniref:hypothetical protein n=1 Tax=unclassified Oceanispirochaeta TaxID=2635722 RepID=UPI000E090366|nr:MULTISPECIES: hypothetical protein [unclassified Oceanispirochaeta]RDG31914.1 hypothetical protein DV872_10115 [Oceanispirochaeta sp. M1]